MGAYVDHSFPRGFILDEERVRRIKDTLESRLSKRPNPISPTYKVYRGDGYSYTTQLIDDVTREDNEDWRRITRLDVTADEKDKLELKLTFGAKGVDLNIIGDDRDEVYLLFSDLRDYIQNEVAVVRAVPEGFGALVTVIAITLLVLIFLGPLAYQSRGRSPEEYKSLLRSADTIPKLNFLIESARRQDLGRMGFFGILGMLAVLVLMITHSFQRIGEYFFPSNQFIFGKQKQAFDRRQRFRSNLFWVGIVGLAVSLVAGFVVWYATRTG